MGPISRRAACVAFGNLVLACTTRSNPPATTAPATSATAPPPPPGTLSALQVEALGRTVDIPAEIRPAFSGKGFLPPPPVKPGDWLSRQHEAGQTFDAYVHSYPSLPSKERSVLALIPLGELSVSAEILREYIEVFFGLNVTLLPADASEAWTSLARLDKATKSRHYFASDVVQYVRHRLPPDAFTLVGLTEDSLHSDESWGFVYGQSSPEDRVAIFTFARSMPLPAKGASVIDDPRMLSRYLRIASHEVAHAFGMAHCIYFTCLMSGAASIEEADARPMHVCPVCLRKLAWAGNGDIVARYRKLARFYARYALKEESLWTEARLRDLQARG